MITTPTYNVDRCWLPERWHDLIWTDFDDQSLIQKGTIFFDHQAHTMYAGEVINFGTRNGHLLAIVRWYKSVDNIFDEAFTPIQLQHARLYWADPVMQKE